VSSFAVGTPRFARAASIRNPPKERRYSPTTLDRSFSIGIKRINKLLDFIKGVESFAGRFPALAECLGGIAGPHLSDDGQREHLASRRDDLPGLALSQGPLASVKTPPHQMFDPTV
jgi:hypothetical protein